MSVRQATRLFLTYVQEKFREDMITDIYEECVASWHLLWCDVELNKEKAKLFLTFFVS